MKVAIYTRVSTGQQTVENQRLELHRYVEARGWSGYREYSDQGFSGKSARRPALEELLADAR